MSIGGRLCFGVTVSTNMSPDCIRNHTLCPVLACDESDSCYAVYESSNGSLVPKLLSCVLTTHRHCGNESCPMQYDRKKNGYDCCCKGPMCNSNIIFPSTLHTKKDTSSVDSNKDSSAGVIPKSISRTQFTLFYICASLFFGFVLGGLAAVFFFKRKQRHAAHSKRPINRATATSPMLTLETRAAQVLDIIHHGRMSCVLKGVYMDRDVAIKVLQKENKKLWDTEKDMFQKYGLKDINILTFVAAEKRFFNNDLQFWIVTEYCPNGSLSDYLRACVLTTKDFFKMFQSIVKGIRYLHSGDMTTDRPIIGHRDIKSGNILVKRDLTCCLGDLGLAIPLSENVVISHDLSQVGTKRYMAPEILQGSITFYQESILQIDMYALGLVTWELLSRTQFSTNATPGAYKPPYYDLVACHPTIDDMLKFVVAEKKRPSIQPHWKESQSFDLICNTMESCWEDDGEARLTIQCVHERVKQLIYEPLDEIYDHTFLSALKSPVTHARLLTQHNTTNEQ